MITTHFLKAIKKSEKTKNNVNNIFETPALFSLLPDLKNKSVLDLGCGNGSRCFKFEKNI
jgi:2-polyprenyl-3-methyl-5-hydroxy-6-metoxy-1,4-benzoquinol methylase